MSGRSRTIASPSATCCLTTAYSSAVSDPACAGWCRGCRSCRRRGGAPRCEEAAARRRQAQPVGEEEGVAGDILGMALGVPIRASTTKTSPWSMSKLAACDVCFRPPRWSRAGWHRHRSMASTRATVAVRAARWPFAVGREPAQPGADRDRQALRNPELEARSTRRSRIRSRAASRSCPGSGGVKAMNSSGP